MFLSSGEKIRSLKNLCAKVMGVCVKNLVLGPSPSSCAEERLLRELMIGRGSSKPRCLKLLYSINFRNCDFSSSIMFLMVQIEVLV